MVGQSGIEYEYDRFLRGKPGATPHPGRRARPPHGPARQRAAPRAGDNVRLTIDSDLQALGEGALGSFGLPGRLRRHERRQRRDPGDGLDADLRPRDLHAADHPGAVRGAGLAQERRPARQPRDPGRSTRPGRCSSRSPPSPALDDGPDHAGRRSTTTRRVQDRRADAEERQRRRLRPDQHERRAQGLLGRLLLRARPRRERRPRAAAGRSRTGPAKLGLGEETGIDLPDRARGLVPTPAWRNRLYRQKLTDRALDGRRQHQPRGRPGRPAGEPAADGGRLRGARERRRRSCARTSPSGSRASPARSSRRCKPAPKRHVEISEETRTTIMTGPDPGRDGGGRAPPIQVFGNFPFPVAGKTGTAERGFTESGLPIPDQAWYVVDGAGRRPRDRGRGDDRARRLRRRLGRAGRRPDPREVLPAPDHARGPGRPSSRRRPNELPPGAYSRRSRAHAAARHRRAAQPALPRRLDAGRRHRADRASASSPWARRPATTSRATRSTSCCARSSTR